MENLRNAQLRIFKLGKDRVNESFEDDMSGFEDSISKPSVSFNAFSGTGIRSNEFSVATCNVILSDECCFHHIVWF